MSFSYRLSALLRCQRKAHKRVDFRTDVSEQDQISGMNAGKPHTYGPARKRFRLKPSNQTH